MARGHAVLSFKKDALVREAGSGGSGARAAGEGAAALGVQGRVCSALFFFPRGGSAQVARALAGALPARGWRMTLATGSLGEAGDPTHAGSFYAGIDIAAVDYTPAPCKSARPNLRTLRVRIEVIVSCGIRRNHARASECPW